eukprot:GHVT01009765.1.p1 GENE.GHVT01009765.1~~GHVT01009765.1.p1  ORF type:complete len:493 (+),score=90.76 GHVT01009765.1:1377-2855(+)
MEQRLAPLSGARGDSRGDGGGRLRKHSSASRGGSEPRGRSATRGSPTSDIGSVSSCASSGRRPMRSPREGPRDPRRLAPPDAEASRPSRIRSSSSQRPQQHAVPTATNSDANHMQTAGQPQALQTSAPTNAALHGGPQQLGLTNESLKPSLDRMLDLTRIAGIKCWDSDGDWSSWFFSFLDSFKYEGVNKATLEMLKEAATQRQRLQKTEEKIFRMESKYLHISQANGGSMLTGWDPSYAVVRKADTQARTQARKLQRCDDVTKMRGFSMTSVSSPADTWEGSRGRTLTASLRPESGLATGEGEASRMGASRSPSRWAGGVGRSVAREDTSRLAGHFASAGTSPPSSLGRRADASAESSRQERLSRPTITGGAGMGASLSFPTRGRSAMSPNAAVLHSPPSPKVAGLPPGVRPFRLKLFSTKADALKKDRPPNAGQELNLAAPGPQPWATPQSAPHYQQYPQKQTHPKADADPIQRGQPAPKFKKKTPSSQQ